jgi:hypothetical protein
MRTMILLDDDLIAKARDYTGVQEKDVAGPGSAQGSDRARERRLARVGGAEPALKVTPRHRPKAA